MTDSHKRLLAAVARRQERERDLRTIDLSHSATRARKQAAADALDGPAPAPEPQVVDVP